jgi:hypothetical protein
VSLRFNPLAPAFDPHAGSLGVIAAKDGGNTHVLRVATRRSNDTAATAALLMWDCDCGSLPVVNDLRSLALRVGVAGMAGSTT